MKKQDRMREITAHWRRSGEDMLSYSVLQIQNCVLLVSNQQHFWWVVNGLL